MRYRYDATRGRPTPRRPRVGDAPALAIIQQSDVSALTARIQQETSDLTTAFLSCMTKLDAGTITRWDSQQVIVKNWLAARPGSWSGIMPGPTIAEYYQQGQGIESVLRENWYPRFAAVCANVPNPPSAPPPPSLSTSNPASPLALLTALPPIVLLGLVFLVGRQFK